MSVQEGDVFDLHNPFGPTITFEIVRIVNGWTTYRASWRDKELEQLHTKVVTSKSPPPFGETPYVKREVST